MNADPLREWPSKDVNWHPPNLTWGIAMALVLMAAPHAFAATTSGKVEKLSQECNSGKQKACMELETLAVEDKDATVRSLAATKLNDQSLLLKIALSDTDASVRMSALSELTVQPMLARVAMESNDAALGKGAVAKISDQPLLGNVARQAADGAIRKLATQRLADEELLAGISAADPDSAVRDAAKARLSELKQLAETAQSGKDAGIRIAAVDELRDQTLLAKIAVEDRDEKVREAADIDSTSLQNEGLPYGERIAKDWPKLHAGLDIKYVYRLLGPLPPSDWDEMIDAGMTHMSFSIASAQKQWPNIWRVGDANGRVIVNLRNSYFDLSLTNGMLTAFRLKTNTAAK
jgi:hypothetical protein